MLARTANPVLNTVFSQATNSYGYARNHEMTVQGTVNKTALLLFLVLLSAGWTWSRFLTTGPVAVAPFMIGGVIIGLIAGLVTMFKKDLAHITAPIYALAQGLFLGGLSSTFEAMYPGIVIQSVGLTFGTLFCLLGAYRSGMIQASEKFKLGVISATGAIGIVYLLSFILGLFGVNMSFMHGNGLFSIGLSLVVVVIAALNLVLDFDLIEQGARQGAPKQMEWIGAFGLMVTLIWLYVEILRLLSKLRDRRD